MYFTMEQQNCETLGTELLYNLEIAQGQKKCHHQGCFWQARPSAKAKWQHSRHEAQHPGDKHRVEDSRESDSVLKFVTLWCQKKKKKDRGESSHGGRGEDKIGTKQEKILPLPLFLALSFSLPCAQNCAQHGWWVGDSWKTLETESCPLSTSGFIA